VRIRLIALRSLLPRAITREKLLNSAGKCWNQQSEKVRTEDVVGA